MRIMMRLLRRARPLPVLPTTRRSVTDSTRCANSAGWPPLLAAVVQLLILLDSPRDVGVLAPLVLREISYRLLVGEQGPRLRQIAAGNGQTRRVAAATRNATDTSASRLGPTSLFAEG